STLGSDFDTLLAVYTGTPLGSLLEVASDDDHGGFFTSELTFNASSGTSYAIAVDGLGNAAGRLVLSWEFAPAKPPVPIIKQPPADVTAPAGSQVTLQVQADNAQSYQWSFNEREI